MLDFDRFTFLTFDCYGTLIDWERGILAALRPVLDRRGIALSDDQALEVYGALESAAEQPPYRSYRDVLAAVMDGFGEQLGFVPSADDRAALADSVADWPPFPDTVAALRSLASRFRLAILSNIDDDLFAGSARRLGVEFAAVVTAQQVGSYKPDPRNFHTLLDRLDTAPDQVLHVAQSLFHDIAPANALGLTTVWVNRRHDQPGSGATPPATARPDLEVPDLATLARRAVAGGGARMSAEEQRATIEDFQRLDIRTGEITMVEDFPRARTPAYRVVVDFGPEIGTKRSSVQATNYRADELIGMQVVGIVNFPPRNIAGFLSEVLILGVPGVDGALALLTPSRPVRIGGAVY